MNNEFLIKMVDGGLIDIETDQDQEWSGCETCDFGSKYVSNINLYLRKYEVYISLGNMYEAPSIGFLIKILVVRDDIIKTMTELEFIEYVKNAVEQFYNERDLYYEPEIRIVEK